MTYETLISVDDLAAHLHDPAWVILDCRFSLLDPGYGQAQYLQRHISGAQYAHLDEALCGPVIPGITGRHPLPSPEQAAGKFAAFGIGPGVQVVAYDDQGGALAAVRAWWMLRWLGHTAAAVLDGGWQAWQKAGLPVSREVESRPPCEFPFQVHPERLATTDQVDQMRRDPAFRLFDSRTFERYCGLNETIDPVAGHIPGAYSAPYLANLAPEGRFLPPDALRARFERLLAGVPPESAVFYCGSGVTSIHNILAMLHAGLGEAQLYAGSWSEWIASRQRPVALGEQPG